MHRPYVFIGYKQNPVHMILHADERIQNDILKMIRDVLPTGSCDSAQIAQYHLIINNLTKNARLVLRADGYKIRAGLGIIVPFQTDGTPTLG